MTAAGFDASVDGITRMRQQLGDARAHIDQLEAERDDLRERVEHYERERDSWRAAAGNLRTAVTEMTGIEAP